MFYDEFMEALSLQNNVNEELSEPSKMNLKESYLEPLVISKSSFGGYDVTPKSNYDARIQDERKIKHLEDFDTAQEVIDYYIKYGWAENSDDFLILDESCHENSLRESNKPKYWNTRFASKVIDAYNNKKLSLSNIDEWETAYNDGIKPTPSLGTREILQYYIETQKKFNESCHKKSIKESLDNEVHFKAYITNLGEYNDGNLVGEWVSFPIDEDDFNKVLDRIGISPINEEWFVTDYDCDLSGFNWQELGEYPSYDKLQQFGLMLQEIDNVEAVDNAYEVTNDLEAAIEGIQNGNLIFIPGISTERDLGEYYYNELGAPADIEAYFDYEALGRELSFDGYGDNDEETAGEYWCGDEDASDSEIGEAYVDAVGIDGVANPENYFDFEAYGRDLAYNGTFTSDGFVEEV